MADESRSLAAWFRLAGIEPLSPPLEHLPTPLSTGAITDDSRFVHPGDVFVAVRGSAGDGHAFVGEAARRGAAAVIVERIDAEVSLPQVVVRDSREAVARLAAAMAGLTDASPDPLRLVGVTGTNGKTTVTWMLRSMFRSAGRATALLGTVEYDLGVERGRAPLTTPGAIELCTHLRSARRAGAEWAVLEVSSHALDQRRCDGLRFAAGVLTNLSGDHLDYHGTMDAYGAAKRRLMDLLEDDGVAVLNADDPFAASVAQELTTSPSGGSGSSRVGPRRVVRYGIESPDADVRAESVRLDRCGCTFTLCGVGGEAAEVVRLPLVGRHNVSNALAAAATGMALGLSREEIVGGLERMEAVPGRLERVAAASAPFSVFVDYAHTDAALAQALSALRPLTDGRLICVFGCGGDRDRSKRPRMGAVAACGADVAFVTSDNPRSEDPRRIIDDILPGFEGVAPCRVIVEPDRRRAIEGAIGEARPTDTVLIAGKGHEDYQLIGDRVLSFDDVEVAREALRRRVPTPEVVS